MPIELHLVLPLLLLLVVLLLLVLWSRLGLGDRSRPCCVCCPRGCGRLWRRCCRRRSRFGSGRRWCLWWRRRSWSRAEKSESLRPAQHTLPSPVQLDLPAPCLLVVGEQFPFGAIEVHALPHAADLRPRSHCELLDWWRFWEGRHKGRCGARCRGFRRRRGRRLLCRPLRLRLRLRLRLLSPLHPAACLFGPSGRLLLSPCPVPL
mmetsp:Transcript_54599/g.123386  ORF Transcript_54599/g.123386 Transcript_54599/m.123386 type:complete len:205 (-) Transcript_54599:697-1311(-)